MTKYPRKPNGRLTPKQAAFCVEFLKDLNGSAAARRAGYSSKTAGRQCIELLRKPHIHAHIEQLQAERNQRVKIDSDWVLRRLQAELEADAADLYGADGALKAARDWPEVWRRGLVISVRTTELYEREPGTGKNRVIGRMKDVVFADRVKRIELLGKHVAIGAFKERIALGADDPLKILFSQIAGTAIRPQAEKRTIEHQPAHEPEGEG